MPDVTPSRVRVWDLPTRVFHWALAVSFLGLIVSGKIAAGAMPWHARFGYLVASLLLFRSIWGFVGGRWSRFGSFVHSPRSILRHVRGHGDPKHAVGHNPLGAMSVWALLLFLMAQVATGLFSDDRLEFSGPLSAFVSESTVKLVTSYHRYVGQRVLIGLVALHLGAIAYYRLRRKQDLIGPMLRGDKQLAFSAPASRDDLVSRLAAAALFAACAGAVAWLVSLGPS